MLKLLTRRGIYILVFITNIIRNFGLSKAQVACSTTSDCERQFQSGSICIDGFCQKTFTGGCLRQKLGEELVPRRRTCNSHDTQQNIDNGLCEISPFNYTEIRISPGNWESAMFYSWLIQVILSELVHVPVSIDIGDANGTLNFYDAKNDFAFTTISHNYEGLSNSNIYGDCRNTNKNCAHVIPEWWRAYQKHKLNYTEVEETINSMVGYLSWYIPSYLVEKHPSLGSFHGYFGKENQELLAQVFKRPTTWEDYCALVSTNNCTDADGFASGPPETEDEKSSYFFESKNEPRKYYIGHFRATEKNNCTNNPNCTGHFVYYPCAWGGHKDQQLYWNNISLDAVSYNYNTVQQIFQAANATQSAIIHMWFYPDSLVEQYDYRKVPLTETTRECLSNRAILGSRCDASKAELIGDKLGSCGYQVQTLGTLIANSVKKDSLESTEVMRSPAYETLRNIKINDIEVSYMLEDWVKTRGVGPVGFHAREAVCSWLAESFNATDQFKNIKRFIPNTYPREFASNIWSLKWYNYVAIILSGTVIAVVLLAYGATQYYKDAKTIKLAQREFLDLCSLGYLMVCVAAILCAVRPTDISCSAIQWLISIGYTQGMVPLLIKASAVHHLVQHANRLRRVKVHKNRLYFAVLASTVFIGAYLLVWTLVDPLSSTEVLTLDSSGVGNIVHIELYCASSSTIWVYFAFLWEAVHMLASTILSFQSRNIRVEMNESGELARMAYVHLLFFIMRIMVYFLLSTETEIVTSFLLSMDSLLSILLYFGPKVNAARKQKDLPVPDMSPLSMLRHYGITSKKSRNSNKSCTGGSNSQNKKQSDGDDDDDDSSITQLPTTFADTELTTTTRSSITASTRSLFMSSLVQQSSSRSTATLQSSLPDMWKAKYEDEEREENKIQQIEHSEQEKCPTERDNDELDHSNRFAANSSNKEPDEEETPRNGNENPKMLSMVEEVSSEILQSQADSSSEIITARG